MADRVLRLVNNQVRVTVAGGPLVATLAGQAAAAAAQPYVDDAEAAAASAQQNYEDALAIQALGDDAAAIAARVPKNTDGSDFANPLAVRGALSARPADGFVSVEDFYDGVAHAGDYGPALSAALAASPRVMFPEKPAGYDFTTHVTTVLTRDTVIDFNGQTIRSTDGRIRLMGALIASGRALAADVPRYATTISLTDASGVQPGDLFYITTSQKPSLSWGDTKKDLVRIRSVQDDELTLSEGLFFSYYTDDPGLDVLIYRPVKPTLIRPRLEQKGADGEGHVAIFLEGLRDISIIEPSIIGEMPFDRANDVFRQGVWIYRCWGAAIVSPDYEAMSYAVGVYGGSRNVTEINVRARYMHHAHTDVGDWSRGYRLIGLDASDCYQAVNTHVCSDAHAENIRVNDDYGLSNWRVCGGSLRNAYIHSTVDDAAEASQFQNNVPRDGTTDSVTGAPISYNVKHDFRYINEDADLSIDNVEFDTPNRVSTTPLLVSYGRTVHFSRVTAPTAVVGLATGDVENFVNGPGNRFGASALPSPDTVNATSVRYDGSVGRQVIVASAATISLPVGLEVVFVTGTTNISSITATGHAGRKVTLVFTDVLTVSDGGNLALAGNFTTTSGDTLTLACPDGSAWYEVARSVN